MTEAVPWVKWHFDKWRSDPGLRKCSLAARGLWMDLLCIMHNATPYGYLAVNMKPLSERDVAQFVGTSSLKEVKFLMRSLRDAGVFSETSDGVVYCRRLVRDNEIREKSKGYGKSGGNPALNRVNPPEQPSQNVSPLLPLNPEEEREREKKETTLRVAKKRSACSTTWMPDAKGQAYAEARGVTQTEVPRFRDFHIGKGNLMADWNAAWRTWCENAVSFGKAPGLALEQPDRGGKSGGYIPLPMTGLP